MRVVKRLRVDWRRMRRVLRACAVI